MNLRLPSLRLRLVAAVATVVLALAAFPALGQTLQAGFERLRLSGVAGGTVRAVRFGNTSDGFCTGWIASSPNHTLTLERDYPRLSIAVRAPSDTTLVILGPTGTRCSDDHGDDQNPRISGNFGPGEYRVYVGSYDEGQSIRYTLEVTE